MTTTTTQSKPTATRYGYDCPCGNGLFEDYSHGIQGEIRHSYLVCRNGHRWVHAQVGWSQWQWIKGEVDASPANPVVSQGVGHDSA